MAGRNTPTPRPTVLDVHDYQPDRSGYCTYQSETSGRRCGLPRRNRHHRDQITPAQCSPECTAEIAQLTDAVVMAAALYAGHIHGSERRYAEESLHLLATELVAKNQRLAGAYPTETE